MPADERRYWGFLPPAAAGGITALAKLAEERGLYGLFAAQVWGPPWVPLAAAAGATERIQLASGIAIAAARSPFETAMAAIDLDRVSEGRFILGLGSSVVAVTRGFFGSPQDKPMAHLRETVAAVRHIIRGAHRGLTPFEGRWYSADFAGLQPGEPPLREEIPIWIAALRAPLVRMAAEVADGVIGHPMWSIEWAVDQMGPEIEKALARSGRRREEIEINLWPWAAPNPNESEAIEDARPTMAFYGGVQQYESFFEAHGFLDVAKRLQEGVKRGDFQSVAHLVPDEMVRTFVAVGEPDKVRERIERAWSLADSLCIVPPAYGLSPEKLLYYMGMIDTIFYGE